MDLNGWTKRLTHETALQINSLTHETALQINNLTHETAL